MSPLNKIVASFLNFVFNISKIPTREADKFPSSTTMPNVKSMTIDISETNSCDIETDITYINNII